MKKRFVVLTLILTVITAITLCAFTACGSHPDDWGNSGVISPYPDISIDSMPENGIKENPVINTAEQNDLYFSVDAHTAGYSQLKNMILSGYNYGSLAQYVQIDHMLNYFKYDYSTPQDDELLAINASLFDCPYNGEKKLLRIGLTSKQVEIESVKNNIVLLLDVSGSMSGDTKIELMKKAMIQMVENFNNDDIISIVTYSDKTKVIIDGMTIVDNAGEIMLY
ncbi:MAG: von Willebrand factor type A domain-containing protein, partial [Clostridia bacterium]|nr:von Willebrand factor type A domain-containing protein [Clostridia bacterium]